MLFLTVLLFLLTYFFQVPVLQAILGIPFILFFPGFAFFAALMPGRKEISTIERISLGFILSIIIDSIIALVLNYTSLGISLDSVMISMTIFVMIITVIGIVRQIMLPPEEQSMLTFNMNLTYPAASALSITFSIVMIVVVFGGIVTGLYYSFTPKGGEAFTRFYIVKQDDGQLYSQVGSSDDRKVSLILGLTNNERLPVNYKVQVSLDSKTYAEIDPIKLADGQQWQETVTLPTGSHERTEVEFLLYKNNETEPYLEPLRLWIDPPVGIVFSE
jgi:uncharacterized membrane protein